MVYCGKPSRGCQMCRTRRIKCDETKPTCNQCQKSRRQCPGYKDDFDLVFRNETQATERRARRAVDGKKGGTQITLTTSKPFSDCSHALKTPVSDSEIEREMEMCGRYAYQRPTVAPTIAVSEQAPCYFVNNWVLPAQENKRGYFDFLLPMLKNEPPDSHLALAFSAVSLASLANRPNTKGKGLFPQAIGAYTKALKALNLALQTPAHQKSDQTLASILMMGFFENIASEKSNPTAWYSHVEGAVQLVKMRGKKQLRTKVGYSLFMSVRSQMVIQCMSSSKVPSLGTDWWFVEDIGKDDFSTYIMRMSLQIAELRAEVNTALAAYPKTPEYFQEILNLIKRAYAIEQEYQAWEDGLQDEFRPKTVAWVDQVPGGDLKKAEVCPGKVDMFKDIWTANIWNHSRIARLFISGCIVRCAAWICNPVDYRTTPEYAQSVRLSGEIITDIIASVPYLLGWRVDPDGQLVSPNWEALAPEEAIELDGPRGLGGVFLMWPLFTVSNMDYTSDSQRKWVKGRMIFLSEMLGLNHAKVLSSFELRLPSMGIRRDNMVNSPPNAATMAAASAAARGGSAYPVAGQQSLTIEQQNSRPSRTIDGPVLGRAGGGGTMRGGGREVYNLNPHQQREQMQKEAWERDRKNLLKKASNSQGEQTERMLATYLAV